MNRLAIALRTVITGSLFMSIFVVRAQGSNPERLTLRQAIEQAKKNNAAIKAAKQDILAAKARVSQSWSAFMPTLTPSFTYNDIERTGNGNFGLQNFTTSQSTFETSLSLRVLDAGQRISQLRASRAGQSAQEQQSRQTIRQILFSVNQNFVESLRAQELEKVASSQLKRSEIVLDQTKNRVQVGDAAKREILQAQADTLNATVNAITARNRTTTNLANLKAVIGKNYAAEVELENAEFESSPELVYSLKEAVELGLSLRPDLLSREQNIDSQKQSLVTAKIDSGLTYSLDVSYVRQYSPSVAGNQTVNFLLSYPLYDRKASLESLAQQLIQAKRDATSEIETAYLTYEQNKRRLDSAKLAVAAARQNYESAIDSQKLGAADLIEVLTSQVSLVTAEANLIEAKYDTVLSQLRLILATGSPLPGEEI
jgi:outer membrane protein